MVVVSLDLCFFPPLCSHNLEYDSSEEKNPRIIFFNEKDEVVKVSRFVTEAYTLYGRGWMSRQTDVAKL